MSYYGPRPEQLYRELSEIKKDHFESNDRIIFLFYDTEYYIENQFGLILMNTYRIISHLDIPTFCCLIITQQDYIKKNVEYLNQIHFPQDTAILVIEYQVDNSYDHLEQIKNNFNFIKKTFTALNRQPRKHRKIFFSLLDTHQLLKLGQISFGFNKPLYNLSNGTIHIDPTVISRDQLPLDLEIVSPIPFSRCNEHWQLTSRSLNDIFDAFIKNTPEDFTFKNFQEDPVSTGEELHEKIDFIQHSFLYIAIETIFNYPGSFITDKSFKGISRKRPFVMLGPKGNLNKLKEWGFKTFDHWWDEGYDDIADPADRMLAVFDIVKTISKKSNNELIDLANSMVDVLEYNYNHLINDFPALQLNNLDKQCLANLKQ